MTRLISGQKKKVVVKDDTINTKQLQVMCLSVTMIQPISTRLYWMTGILHYISLFGQMMVSLYTYHLYFLYSETSNNKDFETLQFWNFEGADWAGRD